MGVCFLPTTDDLSLFTIEKLPEPEECNAD